MTIRGEDSCGGGSGPVLEWYLVFVAVAVDVVVVVAIVVVVVVVVVVANEWAWPSTLNCSRAKCLFGWSTVRLFRRMKRIEMFELLPMIMIMMN